MIIQVSATHRRVGYLMNVLMEVFLFFAFGMASIALESSCSVACSKP